MFKSASYQQTCYPSTAFFVFCKCMRAYKIEINKCSLQDRSTVHSSIIKSSCTSFHFLYVTFCYLVYGSC